MNGIRQRADRQCLRQPRDALKQDVAAGQQPDQQPFHHLVLAHHPGAHGRADPLERLAGLAQLLCAALQFGFAHRNAGLFARQRFILSPSSS